MSLTAFAVVNGFAGPNPSLGPGTVGVTCSVAIFNSDGSLDMALGPDFIIANVTASAAWADIQAAVTATLQAYFGPDVTVTFFPG
jgi:hypothetical protein